jgi:hypothetical protein
MIPGPEAIEPGLLGPPYEFQELFGLFASRSYNAELKIGHDKSLPLLISFDLTIIPSQLSLRGA